jgi:hypothetical protein
MQIGFSGWNFIAQTCAWQLFVIDAIVFFMKSCKTAEPPIIARDDCVENQHLLCDFSWWFSSNRAIGIFIASGESSWSSVYVLAIIEWYCPANHISDDKWHKDFGDLKDSSALGFVMSHWNWQPAIPAKFGPSRRRCNDEHHSQPSHSKVANAAIRCPDAVGSQWTSSVRDLDGPKPGFFRGPRTTVPQRSLDRRNIQVLIGMELRELWILWWLIRTLMTTTGRLEAVTARLMI